MDGRPQRMPLQTVLQCGTCLSLETTSLSLTRIKARIPGVWGYNPLHHISKKHSKTLMKRQLRKNWFQRWLLRGALIRELFIPA